MNELRIEGHCDSRFAGVREAFRANFGDGGDVGAAVCIAIDGKPVVDLWGGWADAAKTRPWRSDTLVSVASATKALTTVCLLGLVEQGRIDPDAPVARYWPEFGQAGKGEIPVRWLLSHRAGLPANRADLPAEALYDWPRMTAAIAAEAPWWEPGTKHGYHASTFGHLVGELVRRVGDRTVREAGAEICGPLGADYSIGTPRAAWSRCAEVIPDPPLPPGVENYFSAAEKSPQSLAGRVFYNPPRDPADMSTERWRSAELPASNGHASARGLTRFYAALAAGGSIDGVRVLRGETIDRAIVEQSSGPDEVLIAPTRFGLGFQLRLAVPGIGLLPVIPEGEVFGHNGRGGSVGFADRTRGVAFAYVMNQYLTGIPGKADRRWPNLAKAFYAALG